MVTSIEVASWRGTGGLAPPGLQIAKEEGCLQLCRTMTAGKQKTELCATFTRTGSTFPLIVWIGDGSKSQLVLVLELH